MQKRERSRDREREKDVKGRWVQIHINTHMRQIGFIIGRNDAGREKKLNIIHWMNVVVVAVI